MDRLLKDARTSGSFNLSNRCLREVPDEVYKGLDAVGEGENWWEAVELQKLILAHNNIEFLREDLRNLPLLSVLNVSHNKLWPGEILSHFPKLSCLKLDNNPLTQITSDAFETAPKLQILDLSCNAGSLPEHPAFSSLPELQELYLRRMQISFISFEIMSLKQLRILDLSQNNLQLIPEGITNLTSLAELDVSDYNISALPRNWVCLNPAYSIRRPILDRGTKATLKYLKEKIVED